jgi:ribosomal protein S18 acetylase RimI-like enzyme
VGETVRHQGIGGLLLDDALARFRSEGARIVYGAAEEDNTTSIALFRSRGFRVVERDEPGLKEGGLGAWGLRSRMMLVSGEVLLGLRLQAAVAPGADGPT